MYQREKSHGFAFKKTSILKLKNSYIPRRPPHPKPINISPSHYAKLDNEAIHQSICELCTCEHAGNATNFYEYEYVGPTIAIVYSKEGCNGEGVVYIDVKNDYAVKKIDEIVACDPDEEEVIEI